MQRIHFKAVLFGLSVLFIFSIPGPVKGAGKEAPTSQSVLCNQLLDKMVGEWTYLKKEKDGDVSCHLSIQRILQGHFIRLQMKTMKADKKILAERLYFMQFIPDTHHYFLVSLDSTGQATNYMGKADPRVISLEAFIPPEGMSHLRFRFTSDGNLEYSRWNPRNDQRAPEQPDELKVFTKNKPVPTPGTRKTEKSNAAKAGSTPSKPKTPGK